MQGVKLFQGDCLNIMKDIPDESYFNIAKNRIEGTE